MISAFLGPPTENNEDNASGDSSSQEVPIVTECIITLDNDFVGDVVVSLRLEDKELIQEIIRDPIADARVEGHVDWEILGYVSIKPGDSDEERIILFHPWGHCEKGDQFLFADFTRLQELLVKELEASIDRID